MNKLTLEAVLGFGNLILASANVITSFSVLVYVASHNLRSSVARAFCILSAMIALIYLVDVSLAEVQTVVSANLWLRLQWLGIAFIPAAYMHFSVSLLRTTGDTSRWRRVITWGCYGLSLITVLEAVFGTKIVVTAAQTGNLYHLLPGELFWLFSIYYLVVTIAGWVNILNARSRCLTSTSRRRMSYLSLTFAVPSIGVFPYLLIPTTALSFSTNVIEAVTLLGNLGVALATVVFAYIVAYEGALLPDRVIKHNLLHYLLRGPLVAILVIILMLFIPRVDIIWGLPREMVLIVAVTGSIVILQMAINLAKSGIDRLIYRRDRQEIELIQTLETRLLTSTDLEQLLENTLIALCDLLRVPSGFIVTVQDSDLRLRVYCGPREAAENFLTQYAMSDLMALVESSRIDDIVELDDFKSADGHWLLPLKKPGNHAIAGILGIRAVEARPQFDAEQLDGAFGFVRRLELALEDKNLQELIFGILRRLEVELNRVQEWRSLPAFASAGQQLGTEALHEAGFGQSVKDALAQMWGGPKLTQSPLSRMQVVRQRMLENGNVLPKAIRSILQEAIESLRPDGERSMTSSEWMLYNILDLRFVQGQRIRDVAQRLAMSESDFYRKQRVAIDQVAQTLLQMERLSQENAKQEQEA